MIKIGKYVAVIILIISWLLNTGNNLFSQESLIKPVVSIKGKITDKASGRALRIKINVFDIEGRKINITRSSDKDGSFFITGLKPASHYILKLKTEEFSFQKIKITTPDVYGYEEIIRNFSIDPLANEIENIVRK